MASEQGREFLASERSFAHSEKTTSLENSFAKNDPKTRSIASEEQVNDSPIAARRDPFAYRRESP
jgi:hypothetical protein